MSEQLQQLIIMFLEINCEPSDAQVHALAAALGVDKETLEAEVYRMLGQQVNATEDQFVEPSDEAVATVATILDGTDILDGTYDEATTSPDDLVLNDGNLAINDPNPGFKAETKNDGTLPTSVAQDKIVTDTSDDGFIAPPVLGASYRVKAYRRQ